MNRELPVCGPSLSRTTYDRSATRIGVVHLGVGAFHRAHQAPYFDLMMEDTGELGWAIAGVNLRAAQSGDCRRLKGRDGEYVLKTMPPDGNAKYRLVRSIRHILDWVEDADSAERIVADASVQVITITVTESGYFLDKDGDLDLSSQEIRDEIAAVSASTVYGYLRRALSRRMRAGTGPLTIMCCDNIRDNGRLLERNLHAYLAAVADSELAEWIRNNASFPCSMVDRITPRPLRSNSAEIAEMFGIGGDFTVHAESFIQWVVEDDFRGVRPELTAAGVQFVKDVHPYEVAKIRILNGGHTSLVYLGVLHGYRTFDAALRSPGLNRALDEFATMEVIPTLDRDTPVELDSYFRLVKSRFLNGNIADSISRIAMNGASKFPIFVVPTVRECFERGIAPVRAMQGIASWYVFMRHVRVGIVGFEYVEPLWPLVSGYLDRGQETAFARLPELWGDMPDRFPQFPDRVCAKISTLMAQFPTGEAD